MEVITASASSSYDYNFNHKRRRTTEEEGWVHDRCGSCAWEESHDYQLELRRKTPHLASPLPPLPYPLPRGGEKLNNNNVEHRPHHLPPQLVEEPNPKRRRLLNTTPDDEPEPPVAVAETASAAQPTPPHQYYEDIKDTAAHLFGPDDAAALWPSDSLTPQGEGSTVFWDEEAIFNMPHLMATMAEGLLIDPPPTTTNFNDHDYDFSVSLWSWDD